MSERLSTRLGELKTAGRAGFVPFIMAGDPSITISRDILLNLPKHGADIIELGIPFSDPMADGPTIQEAGIRALEAGTTLRDVLELVRHFREADTTTPIILMGYYNPIYHYGTQNFMRDAQAAGVDGLILVDLPAEELADTQTEALAHGIDMIRLIAPTSLANRLPIVTKDASGFVYYIAIKGITGTGSADYSALKAPLDAIRAATDLPIAVGFGIKTRNDVAQVARMANLVVVGSAIVDVVKHTAQSDDVAAAVLARCADLAAGIGQ